MPVITELKSKDFKEGELVWCRDLGHPHYSKWKLELYWGKSVTSVCAKRHMHLVGYINPNTREELGVGGNFPEISHAILIPRWKGPFA